MPGRSVISSGSERVRAGPWRGDRQIALLTPLPDAPVPTTRFVHRCLENLRRQGYKRVVTGALSEAESAGFLTAGFEIAESLHLLTHDLGELPDLPKRHRLRRAAAGDEAAVLVVDHLAFSPFWRFDTCGLAEACAATPNTRFRVNAGESVSAYAITGRAARRGYLQRLAVHPEVRACGLGSSLVIDGLRWLRRWRAEQCLVNTQKDNEVALALYLRLGFRRQDSGLAVLVADLGS